ncbi:hypothetical protein M406DRAFT_340244 [Cryphonectria parasitica EP155]|uniref:Uncharacterized protein n=1 Tax=Cryphonectria parasitica (strain ATCC 38755 / EP155) TaxID=660469 RepID=A0A9P4Y1C1_CRYP1|nr:uncharacterized protein M406DRAFT_340244 [Cryphonectria parasitica EP155]KAF3764693.1 hypothetical protein M406DRAFT_340244 [Cryphonectria parasitica EP155]
MSASRTPLLNFLPLGPVTSASFPKAQQTKPAEPATAAAAAQSAAEHKRRSSSLSSDGKSSGYRVLKVAPVHFGEHAGDHKDDWHEVEVAVE